jgi:NAD(P)-dependent dehydrogenase (short-subunit alcohol dehydrogenase family)
LPTGERRVCLLTGAGGRLGSAFCRDYAGEYDIVAVSRGRVPPVPSQDEHFVDPLAPSHDLPENAAAVHVVRAHLEQPGEIERVVEVALARFGRVDLLVNGAAHVRLHPPGLLDLDGTTADFARTFEVNVGVPLRLASRLANEYWKDRAETNRAANRNVVNVSSLSGSRVYPGGQAVYAASKAALNHLTRHLAAEFESFGVRVNALAPNNFPGIVATEQVAAAVVRLDGESVTGKILPVDVPAG